MSARIRDSVLFLVLAFLDISCRSPNKHMVASKHQTTGEVRSIYCLMSGGVRTPSGIGEFHHSLRADLRQAIVEAHVNSPTAVDQANPIGVFRMPLPADKAVALVRAARGTSFEPPPPMERGMLGSSLITLRVESEGPPLEVSFLSRNLAASKAFRELLDVLDPLLGAVFQQPLQAVRLELSGPPDGEGRFRFVLSSIGSKPLWVMPPASSDPEWPTGVEVAEQHVERPGWTSPPLDWQLQPMQDAAGGKADVALTRLDPGASLSFTSRPWRGRAGVAYFARALLATYAGPPAHQGMPVLKGRLLSPPVPFVAR